MSNTACSITQLIPDVLDRDENAIQELWRRYVSRMEGLARPVVAGLSPGGGDEQDVAQSAFYAFCEAVASGQAPQLENRNELWRLLAAISKRKAIDRVRREHRTRRGGGKTAVSEQMDRVEDDCDSPSQSVQLRESLNDLIRILESHGDPKLKLVLFMRLEGGSPEEIAEKLGCTVRTIQRKLHILERLWWDRNN